VRFHNLAASRKSRYPGDVADDARIPVAIRITRPFGSEDEFLRNELDTITRTTVTLMGAQSRPQGVILRFEVTLSSGDPLLRGEGRVVGFKAAAQGNDSGLTLRFTRLDARSKALVDKAAAMREARARASLHPPPRPAADPARASALPPRPASDSSPGGATISSGQALHSGTQPEPPPLSATQISAPPLSATQVGAPASLQASAFGRGVPPDPPSTNPLVLALDESSPSLPGAPPSAPALPSSGVARRDRTSLERPPAPLREQLLDRLRERAKTLSPDTVASLLARRAKRA
jgi:molecular chaperone DnaK